MSSITGKVVEVATDGGASKALPDVDIAVVTRDGTPISSIVATRTNDLGQFQLVISGESPSSAFVIAKKDGYYEQLIPLAESNVYHFELENKDPEAAEEEKARQENIKLTEDLAIIGAAAIVTAVVGAVIVNDVFKK